MHAFQLIIRPLKNFPEMRIKRVIEALF